MAGGIDTFTSVVSDLGDIFIAGKDISFGEFMTDAFVSFGLGSLGAFASYKVGDFISININKVNGKGKGTWKFDYGRALAKLSRNNVRISGKAVWKSLGADAIEGLCDTIGPVKDLVSSIFDNITGSDESALIAY